MKKTSLLIALIFCTFQAMCGIYYVSPTGNDATGDGSLAKPWKTVRNATLTITTPGNTILVLPGTYIESGSTINLALGVNLAGQNAATTIIKSALTGQWSTFLNLESSLPQNGNQRISGITFDGQYVSETNYKTWIGVWVTFRNNVVFDSCVFQNFFNRGLLINGNGDNRSTIPVDPGVYTTGNVVTNCRFTNCGGNDGNTYGQLNIGGTKDALIQYNYMDQTQRPGTKNGECIKYWGSGYNPGLKIFNNTLKRANHVDNQYNGSNGDWNFAVELFNNTGLEIAYNNIQGSLDINYNRPGQGYPLSIWIHDNIFDHNPVNTKEEQAIVLEFETNQAVIENNKFLNQSTGIAFNVRPPASNGGYNNPKPVGGYSATTNVTIKNNLFTLYNLTEGLCCSRQGIQFYVEGDTKTAYARNIDISNNTFVNLSPAQSTCLDFEYFGVQNGGTPALVGLTVRNNVLVGFTSRYLFGGASVSNAVSENNCVWNCGNNNNAVWPAGVLSENNRKVNPGLDANYLVPEGSPIYGLGIGYKSTGGAPPPTPCVYTYGPYGSCVGGFQYRPVLSVTPGGCVGTPDTVKACTPPQNLPPLVSAGADQTLTVIVQLTGNASDSDGSIVSYLWKKLSGPSGAVIALPTSATTTVTGLKPGTYVFQLTATDNGGLKQTDSVTIVIK